MQSHDVVVLAQLFQDYDFSQSTLSVNDCIESVVDLFDCNFSSVSSIDCFPNHAVVASAHLHDQVILAEYFGINFLPSLSQVLLLYKLVVFVDFLVNLNHLFLIVFILV